MIPLLQFIEKAEGDEEDEELSEEEEVAEDEDDSDHLQTENTDNASESFQKLTVDDGLDEEIESTSASQPLPVLSEENTAVMPVRPFNLSFLCYRYRPKIFYTPNVITFAHGSHEFGMLSVISTP